MEGFEEYIIINPTPQPETRPTQVVAVNEVPVPLPQPETRPTQVVAVNEVPVPLASPVAIWSRNTTLSLIDLYRKYRDKVGTFEIKNLKRLREIVASEINSMHGTSFSAGNCENRWRVIERNYKKYVDDSKQTGRGRKIFEYANEMDDVFGKKKNINPEILLSATSVHLGKNTESNTPEMQNATVTEDMPCSSKSLKSAENTPISRRRTIVQRRNSTLELMRQDKKNYYEKLVEIQKDKLQMEKENLQEKMALKKRKLEMKERETEAYKERNSILKQYLKHKIELPHYL